MSARAWEIAAEALGLPAGPRVRPNPLLWIWYAHWGRLPERHSVWVLYDTTCSTWVLRYFARILTAVIVHPERPWFGMHQVVGTSRAAERERFAVGGMDKRQRGGTVVGIQDDISLATSDAAHRRQDLLQQRTAFVRR